MKVEKYLYNKGWVNRSNRCMRVFNKKEIQEMLDEYASIKCKELESQLKESKKEIERLDELGNTLANEYEYQLKERDEAFCQCSEDVTTGWIETPACNICGKIIESELLTSKTKEDERATD